MLRHGLLAHPWIHISLLDTVFSFSEARTESVCSQTVRNETLIWLAAKHNLRVRPLQKEFIKAIPGEYMTQCLWCHGGRMLSKWKHRNEMKRGGKPSHLQILGRFEKEEQEALGWRDTTRLSQFPQKSAASVGFESLLVGGSAVTLIFSGSYQENLH